MKHWDAPQVAAMAREIKGRYGLGWELLGPPVQSALVEAYVLRVGLAQMGETVAKEPLQELRSVLLEHFNLI